MIGVYKSISCSGASIDTIKEYFAVLLYFPKFCRSFHQPVTGYMPIKRVVAKSAAEIFLIISEWIEPTFLLLTPYSHLLSVEDGIHSSSDLEAILNFLKGFFIVSR